MLGLQPVWVWDLVLWFEAVQFLLSCASCPPLHTATRTRYFVLNNLTLVYFATDNDGEEPPSTRSAPRRTMVLTGVEYAEDHPLGMKVRHWHGLVCTALCTGPLALAFFGLACRPTRVVCRMLAQPRF